MLDDDQSDIPFHDFLASAFLVRLDQDEDFASDLAEWYDERLKGEAGGQRTTHDIVSHSFSGSWSDGRGTSQAPGN